MTISTTSINDVDIDSVVALATAVAADPDTGRTVWSATVDWLGGFRSEATIRDFAPLRSDEPAGLGGTDSAPNPVEQLLAALGNCLAVGYAANATAAGITLDSLQVILEGDLDLQSFLGLRPGHAGFEAIKATVKIDSSAEPQEIADLHAKVTASSPVGHTLQTSIPVAIQLEGQA